MSELQIIESTLERAGRRRRFALALRGLWKGLLIGSVLSLLCAGVYHLLPLPLWTLVLTASLPFAAALVAFLIAGWRKPPMPEVARWVDGKQRLQERLSTALEVSNAEENGAWRHLVMEDAAAHVKGIDMNRLAPFSLTRASRWALLVLALVAGLGFVPEYRSKDYLRKKADEANIKQVGQNLVQITKHSLEQRKPALEPTQKSLEAAKALGDDFGRQKLTRGEALRDLANVAEKLKDQLKELGKDPALRKMEQAARSAGGGDNSPAGIQKQMEALQKQMGSTMASPDALDKFKKDLEKLQEAAKGMAEQNPPASEAERQKISESLSALAKQAQEMGLQLPQLDEALEALAANQTDLVLKNLQASLNDLAKLRDMAKQLQQLQQQAEKIGKDLAEQLKNGQAEAAQSTLDKMVEQLKSAGLTPEQMQKMMEEVAKAMDPASKYGKVGEHLKNASKQMKSGDKAQAAQSLAKASDELKQLMQQMADAQQLAAELAALNQAAMAIGNGQGWMQVRRPGSNRSNRPGGGVGTWANEDQADYTGEFTDRWDNSGFLRPDQDARGLSDRGDGDINDGFSPTKVRGQFSPGAQMPSVTLKGVSIKGQSKVGYEEAATAAQSEAQSALSQEKVPRAYQGAVREYFDDLKK